MDCRHIDVGIRRYSTYDLRAMFQRGELVIPDHKKDVSRASEFIEGMFLGAIPTNMVFLFKSIDGKPTYTVLDGKKRMDAILDFLNGDLKLTGMEFLTHMEGMVVKDIQVGFELSLLESYFNVTLIRDVYKDKEVTDSLIRRLTHD